MTINQRKKWLKNNLEKTFEGDTEKFMQHTAELITFYQEEMNKRIRENTRIYNTINKIKT